MKKIILVAFLLATCVALAQTPQQPKFETNLVERSWAPSYSDLYCSGFITNEHIADTNLVAGGVNSPNETLYATGNQIFLKGSGYAEGSRYTVLRELQDPNRYEPFKGQREEVAAVGQPYAEIGRVRVVAIRGPIAIAEVEFTCQNITIGDIVVPFKEHEPVTYRKDTKMERYPTAPGRVSARIIMGQEFDTQIGTGRKVYINVGANKGVKVGDYFRAVRGYDPDKIDPVDSTAMMAPVSDDTQKHPGHLDKETAKQMPPRNLGEMIVLDVTPTSSTAMITNALETIQVGDQVELEGETAASGQ